MALFFLPLPALGRIDLAMLYPLVIAYPLLSALLELSAACPQPPRTTTRLR